MKKKAKTTRIILLGAAFSRTKEDTVIFGAEEDS